MYKRFFSFGDYVIHSDFMSGEQRVGRITNIHLKGKDKYGEPIYEYEVSFKNGTKFVCSGASLHKTK